MGSIVLGVVFRFFLCLSGKGFYCLIGVLIVNRMDFFI